MRKPFLLLALSTCGLVLFAATSRSDVAPDPELEAPTAGTDEPTLDTPAVIAPGSEGAGHMPFTNYDVGGPDALWSRGDLSAAEQAVADRGLDTKGWQATHDAFASAVAERSKQAVADAAQHELGMVDELAGIGVSP